MKRGGPKKITQLLGFKTWQTNELLVESIWSGPRFCPSLRNFTENSIAFVPIPKLLLLSLNNEQV